MPPFAVHEKEEPLTVIVALSPFCDVVPLVTGSRLVSLHDGSSEAHDGFPTLTTGVTDAAPATAGAARAAATAAPTPPR